MSTESHHYVFFAKSTKLSPKILEVYSRGQTNVGQTLRDPDTVHVGITSWNYLVMSLNHIVWLPCLFEVGGQSSRRNRWSAITKIADREPEEWSLWISVDNVEEQFLFIRKFQQVCTKINSKIGTNEYDNLNVNE